MSAPPLLSSRGLLIEKSTVDFDLYPGDVLAVLGENGSGKSLLLSCLSGHLRAPSGSVYLNGHLRAAPDPSVGVMFQHHGLLRSMSVFENVALPFLVKELYLDAKLHQQVLLRLKLVGCEHLQKHEAQRLSEGDKRCIALARALSANTRLLIADEPVAALSPAKKARIFELLEALIKTKVLSGMVLATQDHEFARRIATQFLFLRPGGHTVIPRGHAHFEEQFRQLTQPRPHEMES